MTPGDADAGAPSVPSAPARIPDVRLLVEGVIGAILTLTLVGYMLLGNYTRYVADDYGTALAVTLRGYWAQQVAAYRLTDGHFVATALQTAIALLNPTVVRVLPGVLVVAWVAAVLLALRHLVPGAGRLGRFLLATGIVYATLRATPSPFLALYWMTASVAFVVPLIIAAVVIWLITRPSRRGRLGTARLILIGVLAFIASGEAEIYTVAAFVASTIAVVVAVSPVFPVWRARLPQIAAAWIGAVAGLAAELASPGNGLRSAVISKIVAVPRPSFIDLPFFTFSRMLHFAHALAVQHWRGLLALAVLAAFIAAWSGAAPKLITRTGLIALALATVGTTMVVWAAMAPASLELGGLPPLYDQLILVYACVCAVVTLGWIAGRVLRNRVDSAATQLRLPGEIRGLAAAGATLVVAAIVVAGPIGTLATMQQDLPSYQAYAAGKDAQAAAAEAARAAGLSSIIVRPLVNVENIGILDHTPLEELTTDPTYWINEDTAEYYGIRNMAVSH